MISKLTVHKHCSALIAEKIAAARQLLVQAQEGANNETKSTVGDKHDTARAMAHLEQDKHARILAQHIEMEKTLIQMQPAKSHKKVQFGSLVQCTNGIFYISVSLGKCNIDGTEVFAMSSQSPLTQQLIGKVEGADFSINGRKHSILAVE